MPLRSSLTSQQFDPRLVGDNLAAARVLLDIYSDDALRISQNPMVKTALC